MELRLIQFKGSSFYNGCAAGVHLWAFKRIFCNENNFIAKALGGRLAGYLVEPILDVGAGIGDIAASAYPHLEAVLLDINYDLHVTPSQKHKLWRAKFFDLNSELESAWGTLIFSHVLQYLDSDLDRLKAAIQLASPSVLIDVLNDNTGAFGAIVRRLGNSLRISNPEYKIAYVPIEYELVDRCAFCATIECPNFDILARCFLGHIMDTEVNEENIRIAIEVLRSHLEAPSLSIAETISVYRRLG